jgi:hypothetical protein
MLVIHGKCENVCTLHLQGAASRGERALLTAKGTAAYAEAFAFSRRAVQAALHGGGERGMLNRHDPAVIVARPL